jgi:A/G-specific adenine glycosylase
MNDIRKHAFRCSARIPRHIVIHIRSKTRSTSHLANEFRNTHARLNSYTSNLFDPSFLNVDVGTALISKPKMSSFKGKSCKPLRRRKQELVLSLLSWFKKNGRVLPWRNTNSEYEILIAEILLQKTSSKQVECIYVDFLRSFPSFKRLAEAEPGEIGEKIKGIGLKYRAARLQNMARMILMDFDGKVPKERKKLLELPGVGDYIANAVLCFAFGEDTPIVDVNVVRVLTRVFSIATIREKHKDKNLWALAGELIPKGFCREFNWALLDLASLVCTPRKPKCTKCPILSFCDYGKVQTLSPFKK